MLQWIRENPQHFLCVALLIARLGDIISTRLVSPQLKLEANPIVRRLGWKFAFATALVCFFPYFEWRSSIMLLVASLLVSASNAGKIWIVRAMGEDEYVRFMLRLAMRSTLASALAPALASAALVTLAGVVLWIFNPDPQGTAYWFAQGIIVYGVIIAAYGSLAIWKLFKRAAALKGAD